MRKGDSILAAGGEIAAAVMAMVEMSWFSCLGFWGKGFKACDALIWTLCYQDVRIVGFFRKM
jgi:hypothetical protein